jgi:hypothetical protein
MLNLFTRDVTRDWVHVKFQSEPHREACKNTQRIQILKCLRAVQQFLFGKVYELLLLQVSIIATKPVGMRNELLLKKVREMDRQWVPKMGYPIRHYHLA